MARKKKSVESSGKRKTAVARASVKAGKGRVRVNSEPIEILQPSLARRKSMEPLIIADAMNRLSKVDISITCLLYTSPSPRDVSTSRMPSSA